MNLKSILPKFAVLCVLVVSLAACQTTGTKKDYSAFREADPRSVLVVPVVNNSVEVDAPDLFLSTLSRYIGERGYYVFPVNLVKNVMEEDGMGDANMVHEADPTRLGEIFGSDTVLYVKINTWTAQYLVFSTTVTVELEYTLKDTHSGQTLWSDNQVRQWSPQSQSGGHPLAALLAAAINAAIAKAAPNYIPLAQQANYAAFNQLNTGIPAGPYSPQYQNDMADF
ncbi:MAG: DUF799 family lipoprotein [Methylocystaceae bacterium]|nr:DUF799 family lipoprotein [Methylocystaceae bacterium]